MGSRAGRALALLGWRFFVGALVMGLCAALGLVKIQLKGKKKAPLLRVALLSPVIYFIGETVGIRLTTASESGAFLACIPVVSLAASALILKKKPGRRQLAGILVTLLGVLITVLAFFLSNVAIARIGVNRTSSFIGVSTVVSILAGMLLLGEGFSAMQMLGAAVILAGVYAANASGMPEG